jgi:UDP-2,3-diacylglucosamine hydrolase
VTNPILGTRITELSGDAARPAYLLSDLHVPANGGTVVAHLTAWLAMARAERARMFMLGDLFDTYIAKAQVRVGIVREVAKQCLAAVSAGVELTILHGNRDFLLGREFEQASGARVVSGGVRVRLGAFDALLLHGDELCVKDLPYQRAKRWLRSWPIRQLARRLPLGLALRVANRARSQSELVIKSGDQLRFDPTAAAIAAAFQSGAELLVFGHIHRPARGHFNAGQYCILPAFDAGGVGIQIRGAELRYVCCGKAGLEQVPDPGARTFP